MSIESAYPLSTNEPVEQGAELEQDSQLHVNENTAAIVSAVTVNEHGGVFVFGEPMGVDAVDVGGGQVYVEMDTQMSKGVVAALKRILASDVRNGKDWEEFAGIVVTPQVLKHLISQGLVRREDILQARTVEEDKRAESTFSGYTLYEVFEPDTEPAIDDDHPFYSKRLVIMPKTAIEEEYGVISNILTIDQSGKIL